MLRVSDSLDACTYIRRAIYKNCCFLTSQFRFDSHKWLVFSLAEKQLPNNNVSKFKRNKMPTKIKRKIHLSFSFSCSAKREAPGRGSKTESIKCILKVKCNSNSPIYIGIVIPSFDGPSRALFNGCVNVNAIAIDLICVGGSCGWIMMMLNCAITWISFC